MISLDIYLLYETVFTLVLKDMLTFMFGMSGKQVLLVDRSFIDSFGLNTSVYYERVLSFGSGKALFW